MKVRPITMLLVTLLFAGFVAHAAWKESRRCPVVGACASIHLQLMRGYDWSHAGPPAQADAGPLLRLASH
jgi:hypothetical protein